MRLRDGRKFSSEPTIRRRIAAAHNTPQNRQKHSPNP